MYFPRCCRVREFNLISFLSSEEGIRIIWKLEKFVDLLFKDDLLKWKCMFIVIKNGSGWHEVVMTHEWNVFEM